MFGIGFWEMLVIAALVLVAVGPDRLPQMMRQASRFYRQFRRTADEMRASTGIDQMLKDEELRELAELRRQKLELLAAGKGSATVPGKPLAKPPAGAPDPLGETVPAGKPGVGLAPLAVAARRGLVRGLDDDERERESPGIGVDLDEARRLEPPVPAKTTASLATPAPATREVLEEPSATGGA